ncbi:TetR family transcriptional regulator [Microbacterium sp. P06]|uniref:TetR family transcriptional regulator n=1 Tax=unclassified Microbacterium TaxID=2609290 RepID=UPI003745567B
MSQPQGRAGKANRGPAAGPENRRALIDAARAIFQEQGLGAPLSAVARRAGVGQGSLYRHFPDRLALASAVFEENVADLERFAQPPDVTLEGLFDQIVAQALESSAFIELTTANRHDPNVLHLGDRFRGVVVRLLERERAAGHVGEHVEVEDVLLATGMLATELARTDAGDREAVAARIRGLVRRALAP